MPRERAYFQWLVDNFCMDLLGDPHLFEHHCLLDQMYRKDYYYVMRMDENRADEGVYLRYLFSLDNDAPTPEGPCSFLEFLAALSGRLSRTLAEGEELPPYLYFWELATNLGLSEFNDEAYGHDSTVFIVDEIMTNFMDRKYGRKGCGGLFPLERPTRNQAKVEVYYQMQAYLFEHPGFFREVRS